MLAGRATVERYVAARQARLEQATQSVLAQAREDASQAR
jgi:hypothetical protein